MFYGFTGLTCAACEKIFKLDLTLLKQPSEEEWKKLCTILNKRDNLCEECTKSL